ncbi:MAG: DHHA1 domain-containing protein, partial [Pseudomonadota bacterium]
RKQIALGGGASDGPEAKEIGGVTFLAQALSGVSAKDLRGLIDEHKKRLGSGAVLLITDAGGKAAVAAGVTDDLTDKLSAVDLAQDAVGALGGQGAGGRPGMAQGGGPDVSKAADAIAAAEQVLAG